MAGTTIVITWMDGPVATYEDATASVLNGVLHIHRRDRGGAPVGEWHFPTNNIRAWGPRMWTADDRKDVA